MALYNNGADVPSPQEASNGFSQPGASGTWHKGEEEVRLVEPSLVKKAHREILDHERKRRVELKCMELQEMMEEQGYSEEEIRQKVGTFRQMLMEKEGVRPLLPHGNLGSPAPAGTPCPATAGEVRGGAGVCLHRVKERHHRGRPNSSSESSAKHSRHASERRKSPSPSPGQRSSSWSSSGSLSKSRSRSREKRVGRSRSRSPSPKKPASRSAPGGLRHGGHGYPQWAQRASVAQGGPSCPGAREGANRSLLAPVALEMSAPGGGCHSHGGLRCMGCPCIPPGTPAHTPDASPPPHGAERRTTSPEHATVTPIPPAPGAAPGATPPSGRGDVTPPASWSPGGSRGGSRHTAKALPRPLARPRAELCCQAALMDGWMDGWMGGWTDEWTDKWMRSSADG
uniref:CWF21 domain-containing protein n=1 Tax=Aquila chrysaetos chrysaetos TaxID=223781 RepID=A0A663E2N2_AQUCH